MTTRDEILAMDAAQLRLAIAEEKGWVRQYGRMDSASSREHEYFFMPDGRKSLYPPDWTSEISWAWELVEELRQNFFSTELIEWDHTKTVYVVCHPRQGHGENLPELEAFAETAPLAIARAWLMWKEGV